MKSHLDLINNVTTANEGMQNTLTIVAHVKENPQYHAELETYVLRKKM